MHPALYTTPQSDQTRCRETRAMDMHPALYTTPQSDQTRCRETRAMDMRASVNGESTRVLDPSGLTSIDMIRMSSRRRSRLAFALVHDVTVLNTFSTDEVWLSNRIHPAGVTAPLVVHRCHDCARGGGGGKSNHTKEE